MSGIPVWARVGAKVVCVDDRWNSEVTSPLCAGAIYTISQIFAPRPGRFNNEDTFTAAIDFVEASSCYGKGFSICRFRPLVTKSQEQDIALFRYHLDGVDA